jgi:hypothetical protein
MMFDITDNDNDEKSQVTGYYDYITTQRRERWLELDDEILVRVPSNHYSTMLRGVKKLAEERVIKERVDDLRKESRNPWTEWSTLIIEVLVIAISCLIFAQLPAQFLKETGKNIYATSGGLLVGALLGYAAHQSVVNIIVIMTLRMSYRSARQKIQARQQSPLKSDLLE